MSTDRQIEANQRNAQNSTGPTTTAGKEISAANATTHGVYATKPVAISRGPLVEDQAQLDEFVGSLVRALAPRGTLEREQAHRVAMSYVRLRRVMKLEDLGYEKVTTLSGLTRHVAAICAVNSRIGAGLSRALNEYRALVKMRPPKGSFAATLIEMAETLESQMALGPKPDAAEPSPAPTELAPPTANSRNEPNSRPSVTPAAALDNSEREAAAS